jgi:hypothetical protein
LTPEDKVRVHQEIFQLVYHGNGFTHDEVYTMPIFLRYFYLKMLVGQKQKESESGQEQSDAPVRKTPAGPPFTKKQI